MTPHRVETTPPPAHRYPAQLIRQWTLADGRQVIVRPVLPQDDGLARDFVATLSATARRLRFHGALKALSASAAARFVTVDYRRELALVAVALEPRGDDEVERVVAEVRYASTGAACAEFAVAVADGWDGQGLARRLLVLLSDAARRNGVDTLEGAVLAGNARMLMLAGGLGFDADPEDAEGVVRVWRRLALPLPAPRTNGSGRRSEPLQRLQRFVRRAFSGWRLQPLAL